MSKCDINKVTLKLRFLFQVISEKHCVTKILQEI